MVTFLQANARLLHFWMVLLCFLTIICSRELTRENPELQKNMKFFPLVASHQLKQHLRIRVVHRQKTFLRPRHQFGIANILWLWHLFGLKQTQYDLELTRIGDAGAKMFSARRTTLLLRCCFSWWDATRGKNFMFFCNAGFSLVNFFEQIIVKKQSGTIQKCNNHFPVKMLTLFCSTTRHHGVLCTAAVYLPFLEKIYINGLIKKKFKQLV